MGSFVRRTKGAREGPALNKLLISLVGAGAVVGAVAVAGVSLARKTGRGASGSGELAAVETQLSALRESVDGLLAEMRSLRLAQESAGMARLAPAALALSAPEAADGDGDEAAGALPTYVAAVLAEERKLQEAERERQREERRQKMEERRLELDAMKEGPYDKYNLKVNSLGKVLNLTEAQKGSYYQLAAAYQAKLDESLKQMREARDAERKAAAANGEASQDGQQGPGRGRRGGDPNAGGREQFRELFDDLQKSFTADVTSLLSAEQAQTYSELGRSAQSFQSTEMVSAPGEGGGPPGGGFGGGAFGGGFGGRGAGGPGGGGRRGGR